MIERNDYMSRNFFNYTSNHASIIHTPLAGMRFDNFCTKNSAQSHQKIKKANMSMDIFYGGQGIDNSLDFKKITIVPVENVSSSQALQMCSKVHSIVQDTLAKYGRNALSDHSKGFLPNLTSNEEALAIIMNAIQKAEYQPGKQLAIAIDVCASALFVEGQYNFSGEGFIKTSSEMIEYYTMLLQEYPILFIQDGLSKDDHTGWQLLTQRFKNKIKMLCITADTIDIEFSL